MPKEKTKAANPVVQTTTDYGIFKQVSGNRQLNKYHLQSLKKSIQSKDLLAWNPIMVDENMGVVDGQHRLQVAKDLGKPISYVVLEGANFTDVTNLNTYMRSWGLEDYLNAWIERGKLDYIKVRDFSNKWGLSLSNSIALLGVDGVSKAFSAPKSIFKVGEFEVVDEKLSGDVAAFWKGLKNHVHPGAYQQRDFTRSAYLIYINEDIDRDRLMRKLEAMPVGKKIGPFANIREWLRGFEDVYNSGLGGNTGTRFI